MDLLNLTRLNLLHPRLRDDAKSCCMLAEICLPAGRAIRITQTLRTISEQNDLYAQGRTKPGNIVTNAQGGNSYHNYGLALDFVLLAGGKADWTINDDWMNVVQVFKKHGWEWGGDFKSIVDKPHFQKTFNLSVSQLKFRYDAGKFIDGQYVDI